jgi:hypothetical protein
VGTGAESTIAQIAAAPAVVLTRKIAAYASSADGNHVCIAHARVLIGPDQIRTKKCPDCIAKKRPFRWRHEIYSPHGRLRSTFYEDERIQNAIDRGDSEEKVQNCGIACAG